MKKRRNEPLARGIADVPDLAAALERLGPRMKK
jgi:hypothetical protein